jgi:hypothetical protein
LTMNSINVVEFKPREKIVNESAVELLEDFLERVKSGEIDCISIAALTDGSSVTQWSECDHIQALLGAITILEARLIREVIDFD